MGRLQPATHSDRIMPKIYLDLESDTGTCLERVYEERPKISLKASDTLQELDDILLDATTQLPRICRDALVIARRVDILHAAMCRAQELCIKLEREAGEK